MSSHELVEAPEPEYTPRRLVVSGCFRISSAVIPYYQTSLPLPSAVEELQLFEDLPLDLRTKLRLDELFQREIDWERVNDIVRGYLRVPGKLQFFNAITVALIPVDGHKNPMREYGTTPHPSTVPPNLQQSPWRTLDVGGVQIIHQEDSLNARLQWDRKRIFPATIDGQHRLAALRSLVRAGNLTLGQLSTTISVLFLVLDSRVGFSIGDTQRSQEENPILATVREVFIDLNKQAKPVLRTRQILLDDQEIESRCVRQLLAQRVAEEEPGRLPLGLVHWQHKVTAKFNAGRDTGPFITTVELLHSLIDDILDLKHPRDPFSPDHIRQFVRSIDDSIGLSDYISEHPDRYPEILPLKSYVEQYIIRGQTEEVDQPFANLPPRYLPIADAAFADRWRHVLVQILMGFEPYRRFIAEVKSCGGIDGDLAVFLSLPAKAQSMRQADLGESYFARVDRPLQELAKRKTDLPFYAVFQKGLLRVIADYWKDQEQSAKPELFVAEWLHFLRDLFERECFSLKRTCDAGGRSRVWLGIAVTTFGDDDEPTISWSDSTVKKIVAVIRLWKEYYSASHQNPILFLRELRGNGGKKCVNAAKSLFAALQRAVVGDEEEVDSTERSRRASVRLAQIVALGQDPKLGQIQPVDSQQDFDLGGDSTTTDD